MEDADDAVEAGLDTDEAIVFSGASLTYRDGGEPSLEDVTLTVAQWSTADSAKAQYDALAGALSGEELGAGDVKVSGETKGSYVARVDAADDTKAVAVWQNDTAVFRASGAEEAVMDFYMAFPL